MQELWPAAWLTSNELIIAIAGVAVGGMLLRPVRTTETHWAGAGALVLVLVGLLPWREAASAVARGTDVYLFLIGMMLLSELARREGLFDWLAARCVRRAGGSGPRLFLLMYGLGTLVTVFLSNDATAVVLTPAVLAVARKARARPLPHLLACAMVANAASFVLPISNPANLVVFGDKLPSLTAWLATFALPSIAAIGITAAVLAWLHWPVLAQPVQHDVEIPPLEGHARVAAVGLVVSGAVLLATSALHRPLGMPTFLAALASCAIVLARKREAPWELARHVAWPVILLVAALFVLVEGVERAGALAWLAQQAHTLGGGAPVRTAAVLAVATAFASNLMNNLPAGLLAGRLVAGGDFHPLVHSAVALGIDLGPNLSVTGSLATILWLAAMRREGEQVSGLQFLRVGIVAMPLALAGALALLLLVG